MDQSTGNRPLISIEFIVRIIGALTVTVVSWLVGVSIADYINQPPQSVAALLALVGFLVGIILTPYVTTRPLRQIRLSLLNMPPERLTAVIFGILIGLLAGGLFSIPLSFLPTPFREILPLASVFAFSYLSTVIFVLRQNDLKELFKVLAPLRPSHTPLANSAGEADGLYILLDTSVIIDGRITDISKTGFLRSTLFIPSFILRELQYIADSSDPIRRNRGRRGLEVLSILQNESPIPVRITDMDAPDASDADSKLVMIAKELRCPIMTNDYNLNRVAELQGVSVLNINDLSNAIKVAYLPGEPLSVKIIQEGRELGQGVGYLEDGTMVVIEDGIHHISNLVNVVVTKVLQTTAGRMVFARFPTQNELEGRRDNHHS